MHMHIDRQQRLLATEKEHTGRRFRADSLEAVQPGGALFYGKIAQKIKVEAAAFFGNLAHDGLKTRRFDFGPVDVSNRILHLLGWRVSYCLPGAKALPKVIPGGSGLLVSDAMGK